MPFLYITITLLVIGGVIKFLIIPMNQNKKITALINKYENDYTIEKVKAKNFNFIIENKEKRIYLKTIVVPKNSQVTINNVSTWKLQWGGNPYRLGRSYPNERYIHEVIKFIQETHQSDKPIIKIIMLYPGTEKILRYLNESELDIITPEKTPYGYKVTTYDNFEKDFETLINIK